MWQGRRNTVAKVKLKIIMYKKETAKGPICCSTERKGGEGGGGNEQGRDCRSKK